MMINRRSSLSDFDEVYSVRDVSIAETDTASLQLLGLDTAPPLKAKLAIDLLSLATGAY
jgi:hypothetical protein